MLNSLLAKFGLRQEPRQNTDWLNRVRDAEGQRIQAVKEKQQQKWVMMEYVLGARFVDERFDECMRKFEVELALRNPKVSPFECKFSKYIDRGLDRFEIPISQYEKVAAKISGALYPGWEASAEWNMDQQETSTKYGKDIVIAIRRC